MDQRLKPAPHDLGEIHPDWSWFWDGAVVSLPLWDLTQDSGDQETFDLAARVQRTVPFSDANWAPGTDDRGFVIDNTNTSGDTAQVELPNFVDGLSEFTIFFVGTPDGKYTDATIVGGWIGIILHNDAGTGVRFHLRDSGASNQGGWTTDVLQADTEYCIAARLLPDGTMDVFVNGNKNTVRTGASFTVDSSAVSVIGFLEELGNATNDVWGGAAGMLHCMNRGVGDGEILQWTADPYGGYRRFEPVAHLFHTAAGGGGTTVTATKASLSLTGQTGYTDRAFAATKASLSFTERDASFIYDFTAEALKASLSLTPKDATTLAALLVAATKASLSLSPQDAEGQTNITIAATKETLSLTAKDAEHFVHVTVEALKASLSLIGRTGNLLGAEQRINLLFRRYRRGRRGRDNE